VSYTWDYLQANPKEAKRLLGISYEQLTQLIEQGKRLQEQKQAELESQKVRLIRQSGVFPVKLSIEDPMILTLIYLRQGLNFQVLGLLFKVSDSTVNNIFHYWKTLFRKALPFSLLEQEKNSGKNEKILKESLREYELIVDSSEQVRERLMDREEQKLFSSGKKSNHTIKNQFIVLPNGEEIIDVVVGRREPMSDINLWREHKKEFHSKQKFSGDKAYKREGQIKTPYKKPKKPELTDERKQENKEFSSQRIFVEHLIRLVRIFRVAPERFQLHLSKYNSVILTICSLVRLRKGGLVLKVLKSAEAEGEIEVIKQHYFSSLVIATSSIPGSTVELGRSSLMEDSLRNLVPEVA
jgi:hypothetical protein